MFHIKDQERECSVFSFMHHKLTHTPLLERGQYLLDKFLLLAQGK